MKTFVTALTALSLLASTSSAQAQAITFRVDGTEQSTPRYSVLYIAKKIQVIGHNLGQRNEILKVGQLFQVSKNPGSLVQLGGYAAYWPGSHGRYLEPWLHAEQKLGSAKLALNFGTYLPLNGGKQVLVSDDTTLTTRIGKNISCGAALFFQQTVNRPAVIRFGPALTATSGDTRIQVRWLPFGNHDKSLRVQIAKNF